MDYICAERLTPNLPWLASHLAAHAELETSSALLYQLERISVSTVGRILARIQQDQPRLPRKNPRQPNAALRDVPMRRIPWDEHQPGHFEVDLVHHCRFSASGEYLCTLQMVDVATGWSERVAVFGRSYLVIQDGFSRILARLPFPVLEVHPDNDSAFFNNHLLRFWKQLAQRFVCLAVYPIRRMTTASSSRRTLPWSVPSLALTASTPLPKPWSPTSCTTGCGSTTTSFSLSCA